VLASLSNSTMLIITSGPSANLCSIQGVLLKLPGFSNLLLNI
jgi:hypothetical protein